MRLAAAMAMMLGAGSCTPAPEPPPPTLGDSLDHLEATLHNPPIGSVEAAEEVAAKLEPGDHEAWEQIGPLLANESVHPRVRVILLLAVIENADERIAQDLLSMALTWSEWNLHELLPRTREAGRWLDDWNDRSSVVLMPVFLTRLGEAPLRELVGDREEALELLGNAALGGAVSVQSRGEAITILRDSPVSAERKGDVAAEIVAARERGGVGRYLLAMLQPSALPRMRELLAASGADLETMHYGALEALVHMGDLESKALLQAKGRQTTDPKVAEGVPYLLWKIDLQHPPERLLEYIRGLENPYRVDERPWAVRRAAELDIPIAEIREAILAHAEKVAPVDVRNREGRIVFTGRPLLPVKMAGIEVGALVEEDFPDVPLPDPRSMSF